MKLGLFRQTEIKAETIKPEAELEDDGSESAYEASLARVNAFNESAMEKAKTYSPDIKLCVGKSETFIQSVDGKDLFVPISAIEAIQSRGGEKMWQRFFPGYGLGSRPIYSEDGGTTHIEITTKAGIKYRLSIEYTCADILLRELRDIWLSGSRASFSEREGMFLQNRTNPKR